MVIPCTDTRTRELIFANPDSELVRSCFPIEKFENYIISASKEDSVLAEIDRTELLVLKLLDYFKNDFFKWIDSYNCDNCKNACQLRGTQQANPNERQVFSAERSELYYCAACNLNFRFPRINDPKQLLQTRIGRCGEWAIAFTYILHSLSIDVRMISANFDHVWCEYYNRKRERWIHIDPCENVHDNPFMYQIGWRRTIVCCQARGVNEVRDVTWRYTVNWRQTLQDRRQSIVSETENELRFVDINRKLQASLPLEIQQELRMKWIFELGQFLVIGDEIKIDEKAKTERSSGSLMWRLERLEVKSSQSSDCSMLTSDEQTTSQLKHIFRFYNLNLNSECWNLKYYSQKNSYRFSSSFNNASEQTISGWENGIFSSRNVFRNIEHDWKMVYLSRKRHCPAESEGIIEWAFFPQEDFVASLNRIEVNLQGQSFQNGQIQLQVVFENYEKFLKKENSSLLNDFGRIIKFNLNEKLIVSKNQIPNNYDGFIIRAILKNGNGQEAWQHAQLFRYSSVNNQVTPSFEISIFFGKNSL